LPINRNADIKTKTEPMKAQPNIKKEKGRGRQSMPAGNKLVLGAASSQKQEEWEMYCSRSMTLF